MTMPIFLLPLSALRDSFRGRATLQPELIALRYQLATTKRNSRCPLLRPTNRLLWVLLSRFLQNLRDMLVIVKPVTVFGWHLKGFRLMPSTIIVGHVRAQASKRTVLAVMAIPDSLHHRDVLPISRLLRQAEVPKP